MRFAYFTADGKMAVESYHQAYIYKDFVPVHGVSFLYYPALPESSWSLWRKSSAKQTVLWRIVRRLLRVVLIPLWRLAQIMTVALPRYDGYIMGRCLSQPEAAPWLEGLLGRIARAQRKPFILYLPDAMQVVYPAQYQARFRACTHVLAVTPWLEEQMKAKGVRSFLSRVPIDVDRYPMILHRRKKEVAIGFSGGPDNFPALLELEDALADVLNRFPEARLLVVSGRPPIFKNQSIRFKMQKWLGHDPYGSRFELGVEEMLDFDIALAPLLKTDYARGKDSAKLRQYMALGLPVVASNFGVNAEMIENGVSGFLATGPADWIGALGELIQDDSRRARVGRAARERVAQEFDVRQQAPLLAGNLINCCREERHETG